MNLRKLIATLGLVAIAGCVSSGRSVPDGPMPKILPTKGYSCFEQQLGTWGAKSRYYICLFVMDTSSQFYARGSIEHKLDDYVSGLSGTCKVSEPRTFWEAGRPVDDVMNFKVFTIRCD